MSAQAHSEEIRARQRVDRDLKVVVFKTRWTCGPLRVYNNNTVHFRNPLTYLTNFRSRDENKYLNYPPSFFKTNKQYFNNLFIHRFYPFVDELRVTRVHRYYAIKINVCRWWTKYYIYIYLFLLLLLFEGPKANCLYCWSHIPVRQKQLHLFFIKKINLVLISYVKYAKFSSVNCSKISSNYFILILSFDDQIDCQIHIRKSGVTTSSQVRFLSSSILAPQKHFTDI